MHVFHRAYFISILLSAQILHISIESSGPSVGERVTGLFDGIAEIVSEGENVVLGLVEGEIVTVGIDVIGLLVGEFVT